ncbi:MAG: hypothetical protein BGP12_07230 [Rhodospirillales bacterium 70-18]|nr:hypothetical protein [Rhodospirillales bacterium]OJY71543.1 MAG: hypothetical protein BGP12_07230 [Rhodospirillales bacterium 70-18]
MTNELIAAAVALADTLAQENAALAAVDLAGATALLARKQRDGEAFAAAHARAAALVQAGAPPGTQRLLTEAVGARLRDLAAENKRLLERAMRVQGRVIGSLAQAVPRALATSPRYDAGGGIAGAGRPPPVALSARA